MDTEFEHELTYEELSWLFGSYKYSDDFENVRVHRRLAKMLWNELKSRIPTASLRKQKRYAGIYYADSSSSLFCYIACSKIGPEFGIAKKVVNQFQPHLLKHREFPEWDKNKDGLRGFILEDNSVIELVDLLEAAYESKSDRPAHVVRQRHELTVFVKSDTEAINDQDLRPEGGKEVRQSVASERHPRLRALAISYHYRKYHDLKCMACSFDFEKFYGELGRYFIEVHHNKPLGDRAKPEFTDYRTDLDVVCSNCHRMIHRKKGSLLTVQELRSIIEKNARNRGN